MAGTSIGSTGVTFPDSTVQTTAARITSTTTSSAADITLTSSSNAQQVVSMTTGNKRVILPSCTTMTAGPAAFFITNNGSYVFDIAVSTGNSICYLNPGETVTVACTSTATADGGWATDRWGVAGLSAGFAVSSPIDSASATTATLGTIAPVQIVAVTLSSTSFLVAYMDRATQDGYAVVATISGTTISYGTPTAIYVGTMFGYVNAVALSSTAVIVSFETNAGALNTYGLTISGTTITASPAISQGAATYPFALRKLSSTQALQLYVTTQPFARILTHNGASAVTAGTAVAVVSGAVSNPGWGTRVDAAILSSTTFVVVVSNDTVPAMQARYGSVSGTTITFGTAVTGTQLGTSSYSSVSLVPYVYSSTDFGFMFYGSIANVGAQVGVYTWPLSLSGTTVVFGTPARVDDIYNWWDVGDMIGSNEAYQSRTSMVTFVQLDASNGLLIGSATNRIARLKYVPTIGWRMASLMASSNQPQPMTATAIDSTSAINFGIPVLGSNGLSEPASASIMYTNWLKLTN